MANIKSVRLLDNNKTVQPFQPVYALKFAPDVSWSVDGDDTDDWRNWAKNIDVKSWAAGNNNGGNVPGQTPPTKPQKKWKNDTVYAKDLNIKYVSNESCWKWKRLGMFEVAELKQVQDLEVSGIYDMKKLESGIMYNLEFVIKIERNLWFDSPVTFKATFTNKAGKEVVNVKSVDLMNLKNETTTLIHIPLGVFESNDFGVIIFSLTNNSPHTKRGLTIAGCNISAVN